MPVQVFKSGLVVYKKEPVLAFFPDGKVIDTGCTKSFGLLGVKCPETKFLVTPLEACSASNFCCENIYGKCKLKVGHAYYAQSCIIYIIYAETCIIVNEKLVKGNMFILKRLVFMSRYQFFRARPPFMKSVYNYYIIASVYSNLMQ